MNAQIAVLFQVANRGALVTGGSTGFGKAIGWALAAAGASVTLVARRINELNKVVAEFTASIFDDPARAAASSQRTMTRGNAHIADLYGAAIFLASNVSEYVKGQILFVDGGFSAG